MDTPDKNLNTPSSLSRIEDSPVFRYISNLSPIEHVKSVNTGHAFNSLTLVSPSTLFASPQISYHRESRFSIRRHQFLEPSSSDQSGSENETADGNSPVLKQSDCHDKQLECLGNEDSVKEVAPEPHDGCLDLAIELPRTLKYDCGSPDGNTLPFDKASEDIESSAGYHNVENQESQTCFKHEMDLGKVCHPQQNEESEGYDWGEMVSDAAGLLNFDSPNLSKSFEEQNQETAGTGENTFVSTVLQLPQDSNNGLETAEAGSSGDLCKQSEMGEPAADQTDGTLSSGLQDNLDVGDSSLAVDGKEENCSHSSSNERSIRRRCLVFETTGAHKRKQSQGCSAPTPLEPDHKVCDSEKTFVSAKEVKRHSPVVPLRIGLHLNSLASNSKCGEVLETDKPASGKQLITLPGSLTWSSFLSEQNSSLKPLPPGLIKMTAAPGEEEAKAIEESQASTALVSCESDCHSPKNKRNKLERVVEGGASCKRCNCKRSKCLKLYCECFAAGLYCIEPCSCQDCFNMPIHEHLVLETRKQIETRNPLAFAPKVIRRADGDPDLEGENNKTPASARHKRGCNCKKSSCLKRYCECFQGGVGCSVGCRCEGCKNTFGRKDGSDPAETEEEFSSYEKNDTETHSSDNFINKVEQESDHSVTSSEIARPLIRQQITYTGKPPGSLHPCTTTAAPSQCITGKLMASNFPSRQSRFKSSLQAIPESETPDVLRNDTSSPGRVKATSPNSKRISPPHHELTSSAPFRGGRKLILRSIPPFPSLSQAEKQ